jgi:DNA-binding CsgD family transcriptional regulator
VEGIRQVAGGQSLLDPAVTQKLLDRLRNPVEPDPVAGSLTVREREIFDLIADGCTNRQIGQRLFLAEKTVKNYVSGLLTKLGMQRRTQAAVYGATLRQRAGRTLLVKCPAALGVVARSDQQLRAPCHAATAGEFSWSPKIVVRICRIVSSSSSTVRVSRCSRTSSFAVEARLCKLSPAANNRWIT